MEQLLKDTCLRKLCDLNHQVSVHFYVKVPEVRGPVMWGSITKIFTLRESILVPNRGPRRSVNWGPKPERRGSMEATMSGAARIQENLSP